MSIESLKNTRMIDIDLPFEMPNNITLDGVSVTSFVVIKKLIDQAKKVGFDTISFNVNVPISIETGELQLILPSEYESKDFPRDIWRLFDYIESIGLKSHLELNIRDPLTDNPIMKDRVYPGFDVSTFFQSG